MTGLIQRYFIDAANCYVVLHVHLGVSGLSECSHPSKSPGEVGAQGLLLCVSMKNDGTMSLLY